MICLFVNLFFVIYIFCLVALFDPLWKTKIHKKYSNIFGALSEYSNIFECLKCNKSEYKNIFEAQNIRIFVLIPVSRQDSRLATDTGGGFINQLSWSNWSTPRVQAGFTKGKMGA